MARGKNNPVKPSQNVRIKYPRTLHLPWSEGVTNDDKQLKSIDHFVGKRVIVTAKMDGENTTIYSDGMHARSLDSRHHPSRNWVKAKQGEVGWKLPASWRVCGENMFAAHSIKYDNLPSYFMVFSIWDENNQCLSWDETVMWCEELGLHHVPVLYDDKWDETAIKNIWPFAANFGEDMPEGYVVRLADNFNYQKFGQSLAKMVRENHVQTDEHWMFSEITPNKLAEN